jgi:hypothetical protein
MKRLLQISLVLFLTTGLTTVALAQSSNTDITATANVLAQVDVTAGNDLDFGDVTPGTPTSVAVGDATAGTFTVTGNGGSLNLSFTTPSNLTGPGGNLPISFAAGDAAWGDGSTADNTFDPGAGTDLDISGDTSDGEITVFIGGTVSPGAGLQSGSYTGTITLTAAYN